MNLPTQSASRTDDAPAGHDIRAQRVANVFAHLPSVLRVSIVLPALLVLLTRNEFPQPIALGWLGLHVLVSGFRYYGARGFRADTARSVNVARWERTLHIGYALSGLTWSMLLTVLYPASSPLAHPVLGIIITGVASVGLLSTASMHSAYRYFVLSLLLPGVLYKFWLGGTLELTVAVLTAVYAGVLLVISRRSESAWVDSLHAQHRSAELASELEQTVAQLHERHTALLSEMAERREAERKERDGDARLRLALEAAGMHTWEYDVATEAVRITGTPISDGNTDLLAPEHLRDIMQWVHPEDADALRASTRDAKAIGDTMRCEFRLRWNDQWRWMSARGSLTRTDDGQLRMIGVTQDVHRRHEAQEDLVRAKEAAEAANHAKSQFLANMSHEIRTPLNGVVGMLELLDESSLTEEQQHMVHAAERSSEALLTVISNILDISKIEANRMELETIPFDVVRLTEDMAAVLADSAARQGIVFACHVDDDVPRTVAGDPNRLRQVLLNLAANAIKFTSEGEVVVSLERLGNAAADPSRTVLRFSVRDTGIGLTPEQQGRLFQLFSQADMSTSRRFGGSGLGLAISQQLVELMGGTIEVESEAGRGSTFSFTLHMDVTAPTAPAPATHTALMGRRALIVEDNRTNRGILLAQCTALGLQSDTVSTGSAALAVLQDASRRGQPFHLALLDMHMPGMSGLELAQHISADPELSRTAMVLLSSGMAVGALAEARRHGIAEALHKPVRRSELLRALRAALHLDTRSGDSNAAPVEAPNTHLFGETTVAKPATHKSRPHVLVVEDNEVNRQVAHAMLTRLDCTVQLAEGGEEGVRAAQSRRFDLILMDCQMPVVDGFEATRRIRAGRGDSETPPIVALTANALRGDRERCLAAGMHDYLTKPLTLGTLAATLERWLPAPLEQPPMVAKSEASETTSTVPLTHRDPSRSAHPTPSTVAIIDDRALAEVRGLDADGTLTQQIVSLFRTDGVRLVTNVREAQGANDAAALIFAAHKLKSSSGCVGARVVMALCAQFETQARQDQAVCTADDVDALEVAFHEACTALEVYTPAERSA